MTERNKTLPYSEQRAFDVVLKLMQLQMVPGTHWTAYGVGEISDHGYETDSKFLLAGLMPKIKRREIVFEWKYAKLSVELERREYESSNLQPSVVRSLNEGWTSSERLQWRVIGIKIYTTAIKNRDGQKAIFGLKDEESVRFFLSTNKSLYY